MNFNREDIVIFLKQNKFTIILSILSSIIVGMCVFYIFNMNKTKDYSQVNNYTASINESNNSINKDEKEEAEVIFVDIKGEVNNPGVYEFNKNDRIKDAIEKSGGVKEDSDLTTINLSQKLKDQMLIFVPKKNDKTNYVINNSKKIININLATKEELMTITGIGETKAKSIIEYRDNKGDFKKKEDIMKVNGIGKSTFEKIKDEIDV